MSVTDLVMPWYWAFLYKSNNCSLRDPVFLTAVKCDPVSLIAVKYDLIYLIPVSMTQFFLEQ